MKNLKKRYAVCGLSVRGVYQYVLPLIGKGDPDGPRFDDQAELVGILDIDEKRVREFLGKAEIDIPFFGVAQFDQMIRETRPDTVLVVGPDFTHADHIIRGLNSGCDVIVEKPMVTTTEDCRRVREAEKKSGKNLRVTFNMRYVPTHRVLRRLIKNGKIGRVTNIEFTYNLDTSHGASYFYRWNRERAKSGGLVIHKGTHHFDFINWLIDDAPETVFAFGALNYFGPKGANRPLDGNGKPLAYAQEREQCPYFQQHYAGKIDPANPRIVPGWDTFSLNYNVQYPSDHPMYIYDEAIDIEDTISAVVRYRGGASMSYSCNFSTPWEGYILGLNGTKGRLELSHHGNPDPTGRTASPDEEGLITFLNLFGGREEIKVPAVKGGHGGADFTLQSDLFGEPSQDTGELGLLAGSEAGARAVAIGEAVWKSIRDKKSYEIESLLNPSGSEKK